MNEKHQFILQKNRRFISNDLEVEHINNYLIQEYIFTPDLMSKILAKSTRLERSEYFLDLLPNQGKHAFYVFLQALKIASPHLYEALALEDRLIVNIPSQPVQCSETPAKKSEENETIVDHRASRPMMSQNAGVSVVDQCASRHMLSPNARVTEKDLAKIAANMSGDFNIIAGMLGLTSAELYQCQVQHQHSVKDQYFAILYTWRRKNGYGATKANLVRILQEINVDCSVYDHLFS